MTASIHSEKVKHTLNQLHNEANGELPSILKGLSKGIFRKLKPEDMEETFIAMNREQGLLIYKLIRAAKAKHIVEFGTSFGISTIYLAAAAKETGGKVITTELLASKAEKASLHFKMADLNDIIELRVGDAMETMIDIKEGIDFLLLDGWNDLYLPLLKLLEPKLADGCTIITDNANMPSVKPFLAYVRNHEQYLSSPLKTSKGTTEFTV
ncbi:MAG: hypothetical protein F6K11_36775, partial [Leptolyngbya sp. SIO3F4]|nr:hypothetical protein [Leptolyngbya sp. SIO3F4]